MQTKYTRYQENKDRTFQAFAIFSMAIAFFYTVLRAHLLSLTHNEAFSYLYFVRFTDSFVDVLTYKKPTTNNHLLNSLLMRVTTHLFGDSEFAIRLPSLIGHAFFLVGIYKILNLFSRRLFLLIGISLIIFQPFPLDFFSCARGYGLALGFMSLGIYFLFLIVETKNALNRILWSFFSLFMLSLSTLSNLAFLNLWIAFVLIIILIEIFIQKNFFEKIKQIFSILFLTVLPNVFLLGIIYTKPLAKLPTKEFDGGTEGFWKNTIGTLIDCWLRGKVYFENINYLIISVIIFILTTSCFFIYLSMRQKQVTQTTKLLIVTFALLVLPGLLIWMQHVFLGLVFPYCRAAIYLIPIFLILILLLWERLREPFLIPMKKIFHIGIVSIIISILLHSLSGLNLTHFYASRPDAHTKDAVMTMAKLTEGRNLSDGSVKIGIYLGFEPAVNFYLIKNNLKQFRRVNRNGFDGPFDFYYVREEDKGIIEKLNLKILKHYDVYSAYLAVPQDSPFLDIEGSTS